jgi:hypothetical protein
VALPPEKRADVPLGRYELPRRSGESHLYRIGHPLAQWLAEQAMHRKLPPARLVFDYAQYGVQMSTLKPYLGQSGTLAVVLLEVQALGAVEQHLIVSAMSDGGQVLQEDDPEKLLRLPVADTQAVYDTSVPEALSADLEARKAELLRSINQRNLGYFEQEVQKLDAWADDLKMGLEQEIKEIDRVIKEVRRAAAVAPTLEEKLEKQKEQRDLEAKRSKMRRELFARQDEIELERNDLITELEMQLKQNVIERNLYSIQWNID